VTGVPVKGLAPFLLALWYGTISATLPPADSCGGQSSVPEYGIRTVLVRTRFFDAVPLAWRDTLRYSCPTAIAHGGLLVIPYVRKGRPQIGQAALVDSAGNVGCWTPLRVLLNLPWERREPRRRKVRPWRRGRRGRR
jgi:hypothetical protein